MSIIRGFVTQTSYISNTPATVAEFLELSPIALTFARERGEYQDPTIDAGYVLHTFLAVDDIGNKIVLSQGQVTEILSVTKFVLGYMAEATFPYDSTEFKQSVEAAFPGNVKSFDQGNFHTGESITLPDFITWQSMQFSATVKIWLRNEAFENQYSDFEIVVVPPIDSLDRFFGTYGDLAIALKALTITDTMDRINTFKEGRPETVIRAYEYDFLNKDNTAQATSVKWPVLIYGKNGDNVDTIKDAMINYILSNSTHTQAQWEIIFPSLFKRTEFLFYPRWDKIAIANLTTTSALYSSASDPVECVSFAKKVWPSIAPSWIESNLTILPFDYKGVTVLGLNGTNNLYGYSSLTAIYPDYLPVSTSSLDFNRMTIHTRDWVLMMVGLLKVAETADEYSTIDSPMHKVIRDGVLYISQVYDGINYVVACASNLKKG